MVLNGSLDASIARFVGDPRENFDTVFRTDDTLVVAYRKGAPFINENKDLYTATDLNRLPLAVLKAFAGPHKTSIKRAGGEPNFRCCCNRIQTNLQMARDGYAAAVTTFRVLSELDYLDLEFKSLETGVLPTVSLNFITAQPRYRSPIVNNFIRCYAESYNLPVPIFAPEDIDL